MARQPPSRPFTPAMSLVVTAGLGLVVVFGTISLLHALVRVLPAWETPVHIVAHERQQGQDYIGDRLQPSPRSQHRIVVESGDGSRRTLASTKALHDAARRASRSRDGAVMRSSVLADRPLSIALPGKDGTAPEIHSLAMPLPGVLLGAALCWGVVAWSAWRLHRARRGFHWRLFLPGVLVAVALSYLWWSRSI